MDTNERQYDHVTIHGLMLPQNLGKKSEVNAIYIEVESNLNGEFYTIEIDPLNFIDWIGNKQITQIKEFVKGKIDLK